MPQDKRHSVGVLAHSPEFQRQRDTTLQFLLAASLVPALREMAQAQDRLGLPY